MKDREYEITVDHYEDLLKQEKVNAISKVSFHIKYMK